MQLLIPLTAALVPLIMSPGLLFHFDITPKVVLLLIAVTIALLRPAVLRENLADLLSTSYGRWFSAILLLQLISFAVSAFLSSDRWLSIDGSEWRRLGLYTFASVVLFALVTAGWLRSKNNMILLLRSCAISTIPIAAYAIAQYFGLDPFLPSSAYHAGEGPFTIVRPPSTLGHANYLACFLVFAVFASLALLRAAARPSDRVISITAAGIAAAALVLSGTRSGLAGAAAGLITLLITNRASIRRRHLFAGLAMLSIAAAFILSPAGTKLRARIYWSNEDRFGGARLLLWRDSIRMIAARPVVGYGPETFIREFPLFQSPELARAYPDFFHESPHNVLLDAAASQGLPGAVLLAITWCTGTIAGIRAIRQGHPLAASFLAGNIGLLVAHQFIVFVPATALVFLLSQAFLIASVPVAHTPVLPQTRPWRWSVPAFAAAVAVTFVIYAVRLTAADHSLELVRQRIAAGDIEAAIQVYDRTAGIQPRGGTSELYYSREMASAAARNTQHEQQAQLWKQALEAGARCVATCEQRANAWYSLATLLAAQGDTRGVERALRNATAWAPNWFKPHWTLALLLNMTGRQQEAMSEAVTAVDRNGGKNPEVLATWLTLANAARRQ